MSENINGVLMREFRVLSVSVRVFIRYNCDVIGIK